MAAAGVRVSGVAAVTRALAEFGHELEDLEDAFADISREGARLAAGFVHSRSGRLAASVRAGTPLKNTAVVSTGVKYGGVQNYGWPRKNIRAQRFMQKADAELQPYATARLERSINEHIRRRGLK